MCHIPELSVLGETGSRVRGLSQLVLSLSWYLSLSYTIHLLFYHSIHHHCFTA